MRFPTAKQKPQWSITVAFPKVHIGHSSDKKTWKIQSKRWLICLLPQGRAVQPAPGRCSAPQHNSCINIPPAGFARWCSRAAATKLPSLHETCRCNGEKIHSKMQAVNDPLLNTKYICLRYRIIIIIIIVCLGRNLESYLAVCFANRVNVDNVFH